MLKPILYLRFLLRRLLRRQLLLRRPRHLLLRHLIVMLHTLVVLGMFMLLDLLVRVRVGLKPVWMS